MSTNLSEVFQGGASTSQHVDAEDDDHFQNTTFKLKRTRSLGLLDEFIDTEQQEKNIEKKMEDKNERSQSVATGFDAKRSASPESSIASGSASPATTASDGPSSPMPSANSAFLTSPDIIPHDDMDVEVEPSRHVDYLSHQWDVSDISKSWRYVISRRKNVANAARLENASWRTWAQRRSKLKTISPEAVNWSKESDVTWLYGPIVDDDDHDNENGPEESSFNTASSVVAGDISIARKTHRPKPILKKRTMEDMMISHSNLLKLEIASARAEQEQTRREDAAAAARKDAAAKAGSSEKPPEYFDYDVISAKLNSQYKNYSQSNSANNSSLDLAAKNNPQLSSAKLSSALDKLSVDNSPSGNPGTGIASAQLAKQDRHIHFNDEVQQCIAIDETYSDEDYEYDDDENDYDYEGDESYLYDSDAHDPQSTSQDDDDDDDDDEGGFFLNVRSPSSATLAGQGLPGLSSANSSKVHSKEPDHDEASDSISTTNSRVLKTIHLLPPTTLNYDSFDEESDESNPYTSSISHNVGNSSRGYDYYYDYNSVYQVDPNHAIYGENKSKSPIVVDVPENISMGSNFDYEMIENENGSDYSAMSPEIVGHVQRPWPSDDEKEKEKLPISSLNDSVPQKGKPNPFSLDGSDSEDSDSSEEGGGLSISARNSSQSLAQSVFGQPLTAASDDSHYPSAIMDELEPAAEHISSINPNYSSTSLSKQPHSSNSLSGQFFSGGMTKVDDSELKESFFTPKPERVSQSSTPTQLSFPSTQSPPVQTKSSPLPPHTTSANAFSGSRTPSKKSFIFESESESEEESEGENSSPTPQASAEHNPTSYQSLYEVAGRNGIAVPANEEEGQKAKRGNSVTNFLGSWKGN